MLPDRTVQFYNMIFRRTLSRSADAATAPLPDGVRIRTWLPGDERAWARMECALGDFDAEEEAERYFMEKYVAADGGDRCYFALDPAGRAIGSAIAWRDLRDGTPVASLHWLVTDETWQRRGVGRALVRAAMARYRSDGETSVWLHTQPWSWPACLLYVSEGFRWQRSASFAGYENQFREAADVLGRLLPPALFARLLESAED